VAITRQQLQDSELKATLDGAVRQRHAAAGEYLAAGSPIVTLVRLHPLRTPLRERVEIIEGLKPERLVV